MDRHTTDHRGDEQNDFPSAKSKTGESRPWAQAHETPAQSEKGRARDQLTVRISILRNMK